jgi:30S ribosomal protein S31
LKYINVFHSLSCKTKTTTTMGKGDRKTKRGKLFKGSYGKSRPRKMEQTAPAATAEPAAKAKPKAKAKKAGAA